MNEGLGHTVLNKRTTGGAATGGAASLATEVRLKRRTVFCIEFFVFKALVTRRSLAGWHLSWSWLPAIRARPLK